MNDPDWLSLDDYQRLSAETDLEGSSSNPTIAMLGLLGEVGSLAAELKKQTRPDGVEYSGFDSNVKTEIGDILWYLAALARRVGVSLDDAARQNLTATRRRWLKPGRTSLAYDHAFPDSESFPDQLTVRFATTHNQSGRVVSQMLVDDVPLGDPIDDNSFAEDGYRFHDAFHLGYLAVLGWSPVLRRLMNRRRSSEPDVNRNEDGARAAISEEAVAALVFQMAKRYDYFESAVRVDDSILDAVAAITAEFEVRDRSPAEWEQAILSGFAIWRALAASGGGTVHLELSTRSIRIG